MAGYIPAMFLPRAPAPAAQIHIATDTFTLAKTRFAQSWMRREQLAIVIVGDGAVLPTQLAPFQ